MNKDMYDEYDGYYVVNGMAALIFGAVAHAVLYLIFDEARAVHSTYFVLSGYVLLCLCSVCRRLSFSAAYSYAVRQGLVLLWMSCGATVISWAFLHILEYSFHTMALPVQLGVISGLAVTVIDTLSDWGVKLYPQIRSWYISLFAGMGLLGTCIVVVIDKGLLPEWNFLFWGLFLVFIGKRQETYTSVLYSWGLWISLGFYWQVIIKEADLVSASMYVPIAVFVLLFFDFLPRESIRFQVIWAALKRMVVWLLMALVSVLLAQMMSDASIALLTRALRGLAMIGFALMLVVWRKSNRF